MRPTTAGEEWALSPKAYCSGAAIHDRLPAAARGHAAMERANPVVAPEPAAAVPPRTGGPWWAFWTGLGLSLRHWPLLLIFYAALFLLALLALIPLEETLVNWFGYRLAAAEVAEGIPGWLGAQIVRDLPAQSAAIAAPLQAVMLSIPASLLLFSLPFAILGGGALTAYAVGSRRRFWPAVARYIGSFTLLQFLEVALLEVSTALIVLLGGLTTAGLVPLSAQQGSGSAAALLLLLAGAILTILVLVLVALWMLIPWWFEYARVLAVVREQRHVLRLLQHSAAFLRRNLGPAAGLALFNFLLVLMPYIPYTILTAIIPANWWPAHIIVQQLLILAIIATRLARLASQVRLVQARGQAAVPARAAGGSR